MILHFMVFNVGAEQSNKKCRTIKVAVGSVPLKSCLTRLVFLTVCISCHAQKRFKWLFGNTSNITTIFTSFMSSVRLKAIFDLALEDLLRDNGYFDGSIK